jgi:hypothetical protein
MPQIFISYSRKDIAFARKLAGDLEKAGYDVWWDLTDLRGGDDWPRVIPAAIETSQYVIVVLSPNSAVSDWVAKEYTQALDLRKKIIPIMLKPSRVPFALNTINYVNFASGEYIDNLNNLLAALGYTGKPPVEARKPISILPPALRPYSILIIVGFIILFALISFPLLVPPALPSPTVTQTDTSIPPTTPVVTFTSEPDTPTVIPTISLTASATMTFTPTTALTLTTSPTLTPSLTNQPFDMIRFCVNSLYANTINVRSGPGSTTFAPLGEPLPVGTCLNFSARNEEGTWLQIAPIQTDPTLQQYIGGWIYRELLGLGTTGPIDLPAVTLTPTPTPSDTPTTTPTFTRTPTDTPTFTPTLTPSPMDTDTPTPTETSPP